MQSLKKNRTGIAVGTPVRLAALMDNGRFLSLPHPHPPPTGHKGFFSLFLFTF